MLLHRAVVFLQIQIIKIILCTTLALIDVLQKQNKFQTAGLICNDTRTTLDPKTQNMFVVIDMLIRFNVVYSVIFR